MIEAALALSLLYRHHLTEPVVPVPELTKTLVTPITKRDDISIAQISPVVAENGFIFELLGLRSNRWC